MKHLHIDPAPGRPMRSRTFRRPDRRSVLRLHLREPEVQKLRPRLGWLLPLSDGGTPVPLIETPASELWPALAPDGRHMAFMSDRTGRLEIYVSSFPGAQQIWGPISTDGGVQPKWSARGELFYIDGQGLMAVKVDTSAGFSWSAPERVFTQEQVGAALVDPAQLPIAVRYDVADGGERFVVVRSLAGPDSGITIVQNWLAEFDE